MLLSPPKCSGRFGVFQVYSSSILVSHILIIPFDKFFLITFPWNLAIFKTFSIL